MTPRVPSALLEGVLYALVAFAPLAFGCVEPWSRAGLEILAFLLALLCFLRGRPSLPDTADTFWLFPAAMAAFGFVQLLTAASADGPRPQLPFTVASHATRASALLWAAFAAIAWSVPRVVATHEAARRFCRFLFGLGVVLAAQGLLQRATSYKPYWFRAVESWSAFGPYYNRDHAANLMMMSLLVGTGVAVSRARRWPAVDGPHPDYIREQGGRAAAALLLLAAIGVCGARGVFLAMPLTAAVLVYFGSSFAADGRERVLRAAGAAAGAGFLILLVHRYVSASADAGALVDADVSSRLSIYADCVRMWRDAPIFGTGLGAFAAAYPAYQEFELRARVSEAHNDWLQLAVEAGAFGVIVLSAAGVYLLHHALKTWRAARSTEMRALLVGALAAVLAFALHCCFDFNFQIPGNAAVFIVLAGFLSSAASWVDKEVPKSRPEPPPFLEAMWACSLFVVLALVCARPAAAAWVASRGATMAERADALWRGYALDPDPRYLRGLSGIVLRVPPEGKPEDFRKLRAGLAIALKNLELSPLDAEARFRAGIALHRLLRPADGVTLAHEATLIRFLPLDVRAPADPGMERTISILKSKGLMPQRGGKK